MKELGKLIPELAPGRIKKNVRRFWKIYINPPKERSLFLNPEKVPEVTQILDRVATKAQPKQVVYDRSSQRAYVSCMEGMCLQIFEVEGEAISHLKDIPFEDQCVEVALFKNLAFITTTNFARPPQETRNKLWIFDTKTMEKCSSIDTGGNWSKLISISPEGNELLVSNWHSHDISVIDVSDPNNPNLKQILEWGEAPRGIAFLPDGKSAIVTGFYSGNLGVLKKGSSGVWDTAYTGEPFDKPRYPGNMRHVLISDDGKTAFVSNLGRNLLHYWDIGTRSFRKNIQVGKSPNSIDLVESGKKIGVSCRDSSFVYLVETQSGRVIGRSPKTGAEPTGLCGIDSRFLVTCFGDNSLELHKITT